jgi:hypothetical protein
MPTITASDIGKVISPAKAIQTGSIGVNTPPNGTILAATIQKLPVANVA